MRLTYDLRKILKPVSLGVALYAIGSLVFMGLYVYVDYQRYLSSYQITQQVELKAAQKKLRSHIENLKKLSVLTSNRIASFDGDIKQIQSILDSSHSLLPDSDYLKISNITYAKLSKPESMITRFGNLPLTTRNVPSEAPHRKGSSVAFNEDSVSCKTWVFDHESNLGGFLKIYLDLSSFKTMLQLGPTLSFISNKNYVLLQKEPLFIYGKKPASLWMYSYKNISHYIAFFLVMGFSLITIVLSCYYFRFQAHKAYKEKFKTLENQLSKAQVSEGKAKETLFIHQRQAQNHQITCQAAKKLQKSFKIHRKEQINHILRSLDVIMRSFKNPNAQPSTEDLIEIIGSCIDVGERMASDILSKTKNESVKMIKILNEIETLFTERIYKFNITIEIICSEKLHYCNDPLLVKLVLINFIGKPLHKVPKNGKIAIKVTDQREGVHIQVKDSGFPFDEKIQSQIEQSFDFFLLDEDFHQLCQNNNILYECTITKERFNLAKILFSKSTAKPSSSNVVPLFR